MIPFTDEQKDLYDKSTNCDWCKKEFIDDYFCNKYYKKLAPAETERSDHPKIKCHDKKYPIEIVNDKQSLDEHIIKKICKNSNKNKSDVNSCHNIKPFQSNKKFVVMITTLENLKISFAQDVI